MVGFEEHLRTAAINGAKHSLFDFDNVFAAVSLFDCFLGLNLSFDIKVGVDIPAICSQLEIGFDTGWKCDINITVVGAE